MSDDAVRQCGPRPPGRNRSGCLPRGRAEAAAALPPPTPACRRPLRTTAAQSVGSAVEDLLADQAGHDPGHSEEYVAAVGQARPVAILFYVPGSVDDAKVLEAFKTCAGGLSRITPSSPTTTRRRSAYGDLSMLLQVNYPPEIVLIDKAGTVQKIWNGYVDEGTLKQCLINLGQG